MRNFRLSWPGQNWLLDGLNPTAGGSGQWALNVLMCWQWLGPDNGRINWSLGWLIWDGFTRVLSMGSPIVLLLIPTFHKLQTKVNFFLKGVWEKRRNIETSWFGFTRGDFKESSFLPSSSKFLNGWLNSFRYPFCLPSLSLRPRAPPET